jgi:cysteine desulfuration protein SufE
MYDETGSRASGAEAVASRARRIIEEFAGLADPMDRYRRLVVLGEAMPPLPDRDRTDENRLPGCQYAVWIRSTYDPDANVLWFLADSDARITRGLAALIINVVDGLAPSDIVAADLGFLDTIGLRDQLSVHRGNGLAALIEEIRRRARAHLPDPDSP